MSSRKIVKSHSENYSNQVKVNGVGYKRNLMKQEEIDLSSENNLDKESTPKTVHSISICINTFDEVIFLNLYIYVVVVLNILLTDFE